MTIIRRARPVAEPNCGEVEYGILCSQLTFAVYPDLVAADQHATDQAARAYADHLAATHPGLEYSIMGRRAGEPWREVTTGRTARQVLADRWQIRIDGGGW